MGTILVTLALLAAILSSQGLQHDRHVHGPGALEVLQSPEADITVADARQWSLNSSMADSEEIRPADAFRLLQPSLLQNFMTLTQNFSQIELLGNQSGPERLSLTQSRILDAIEAESTVLFEEWHTLQHDSVDSAARLARIAAQSANFSGSFMQQVALESASLVKEMKALEEQSSSQNGKAGPSHAYPQAHVVTRRGQSGHWAKAPPNSNGAEDEVDRETFPWAYGMSSVGLMRMSMALGGVMLILLSLLLTATSWATRKTRSDPGKQSMLLFRGPAVGSRSVEGHGSHEEKTLSVWDGTVATFSTIVGTGLLAMPYAFSLAGLVAAPVIVFFVCCSAYTAHLMAWSLSANAAEAELRGVKPCMRGWGFLAEVAFGRKAKSAINVFLIVELWGYLLSSLVCSAMNFTQVAEELSSSAAVGISVCVTYALTFVPTQLLTSVNVFSNVVFIACCVMFIITGLLLPEKAPSTDVQWVNPRGLISAAGILVFSPAGHGFYPSLMQRMEDPAKFPMCVRRAYVAAVIIYLVVAISGYHLFGSAVRPSAVQNIGADIQLIPIPRLGWMNTLAAVGMVIKMQAMQGLVLTPLSATVEGVLAGVSADNSLKVMVAPTILAVSAGVAVHFATEMAVLLNLLGSVFCMNIAFVVPTVCYWKLARSPVGPLRQFVFISLILLGGTFAVLGVLTTL